MSERRPRWSIYNNILGNVHEPVVISVTDTNDKTDIRPVSNTSGEYLSFR